MDRTFIIFYDGECALCHLLVKWLLKRDKLALFSFAPQSGDAAKKFFSQSTIEELPDSIWVLDKDDTIFLKGDALIFILRKLHGFYKFIAAVFSLLPRVLRNGVYDLVADSRYKIFGRSASNCPVLPENLKTRFLF